MRRILIMMICLAMLLTLATSCTEQTTTPTTATSGDGTTASETTTMGPPAEIVVVYPLFADQVEQDVVAAAINEISLATINVDVTLAPISIANYSQQVPLMITGGEDMDLFETLPGGPTLYASMVNQNQIKDITDLAPMYAQGIIDAINSVNPGYLSGVYISGKMYGFPSLFDKVSSTYADMRKDVLVEAGMLENYQNMKNIDDFETVVAAVDAVSDIPVLCSSGNGWGNVISSTARLTNFDDFDTQIVSEFFSSAEWAYGAIFGTDNTTVVNAYASEYFLEKITIANDWYNKGYISKDAATQIEGGGATIKANGGLGQVTDGELGHQTFNSNETGYDMISVIIAPAIVNTGIMQKFVWALPVSGKDDEAALKFLNLMYTNADVVNLFNYGIEDRHYVTNEDGTISLPEGIESGSASYWVNSSFLFGSQFLAKVVKPDPADLREQALELNKNATTAPLLGFAVDSTSFTNEYTAVINVVTQYAPGLNSGSSDPETTLPQFLSALEAAGMQTIIDDVQSQVDAYIAAQ